MAQEACESVMTKLIARLYYFTQHPSSGAKRSFAIREAVLLAELTKFALVPEDVALRALRMLLANFSPVLADVIVPMLRSCGMGRDGTGRVYTCVCECVCVCVCDCRHACTRHCTVTHTHAALRRIHI